MNIRLSDRDLDIVVFVARHGRVLLRDVERYIMDKYELSLKRSASIIRRLVNDNVLIKRRDGRQRIWISIAPQFVSVITELYSALFTSDRERLRYYEQKVRGVKVVEPEKPEGKVKKPRKKKRKTAEIVEEAVWEKGWEP